MTEKERIIQGIKERIEAEYRKYKDIEGLNWSLIAAGKICSSYNITLKEPKTISLRIKFKKSHMSINNNCVSYNRYSSRGVLCLQGRDDILIHYLDSMNDFAKVIGYFNLDEIESITFK